jgi:hypothetical protein
MVFHTSIVTASSIRMIRPGDYRRCRRRPGRRGRALGRLHQRRADLHRHRTRLRRLRGRRRVHRPARHRGTDAKGRRRPRRHHRPDHHARAARHHPPAHHRRAGRRRHGGTGRGRGGAAAVCAVHHPGRRPRGLDRGAGADFRSGAGGDPGPRRRGGLARANALPDALGGRCSPGAAGWSWPGACDRA